MKKTKPESSIVIRTFNEGHHLPALLDGIALQRYKDYEIIVVDSGSWDRTVPLALERNVRVIKIKSDDFTFGHSLNRGIEEAQGALIAIVSAHTEPMSDRWLENLVAPLRDDRVAMTYGMQRGNHVSKFSEVRDFYRTFREERVATVQETMTVNNANSAIRKDLWQQHPFDEALTGLEDLEWARHWAAKGLNIVYVPEAPILHIHDETWPQVFNRHRREAIAARALGVKGPLNIATELFRELMYAVQDMVVAMRQQQPISVVPEIVYFRVMKYGGTCSGLFRTAESVLTGEKRQSLYFQSHNAAVVVHGPGRAAFKSVPLPRPSPSEVLIRVAYEGICGTDLEIFKGTLGYFKNGMSSYPLTPGHELSGWVTRVGAKAEGLKEGDRVVVECIQGCGVCRPCRQRNPITCAERKELGVMKLNGGYAEFVTVQARFVHKIPPTLDLKKAALCEPLAVVHKGVLRLLGFVDNRGTTNREEFCVIGAGPIGYLSAQLLTHLGKKVVVYDKYPRRLSYYDQRTIQTEPDLKKLLKHSLFIEATGDPDVLDEILHSTPAGSTLLLLGLPYSRKEFSFESIVAYDKAVIGSVGSGSENFVEALKLLPKLVLEPLLQNSIPLQEYEKAWQDFEERKYLKTLLQVASETEIPKR